MAMSEEREPAVQRIYTRLHHLDFTSPDRPNWEDIGILIDAYDVLRAENAALKEKIRKGRITFGMIALSAKGVELELAQAGRALPCSPRSLWSR